MCSYYFGWTICSCSVSLPNKVCYAQSSIIFSLLKCVMNVQLTNVFVLLLGVDNILLTKALPIIVYMSHFLLRKGGGGGGGGKRGGHNSRLQCILWSLRCGSLVPWHLAFELTLSCLVCIIVNICLTIAFLPLGVTWGHNVFMVWVTEKYVWYAAGFVWLFKIVVETHSYTYTVAILWCCLLFTEIPQGWPASCYNDAGCVFISM